MSSVHRLRIFLSSKTSRRDEMREHRDVITSEGFDVCSSWLDTPHRSTTCEAEMELVAITCANDIRGCDILVAFTEHDGSGKGGRHVEYGLAMAERKVIVIVGPREHVFCYYPYVNHIDDSGPWLGQLITFLRYARSVRFPKYD